MRPALGGQRLQPEGYVRQGAALQRVRGEDGESDHTMNSDIAARIARLRAMLADPSMPGGEGSVPALQKAIAALMAGDTASADAALSSFQSDAQRSTDFMATTPGRGSGDQRFTDLRRALHGI